MSLLRLHLDAHPLEPHFAQLLNLLPPETHKKINAFHFQADRNLALGSQLLQRFLIRTLTHPAPPLNSIALAKNPQTNRPFYPRAAEIGLARDAEEWALTSCPPGNPVPQTSYPRSLTPARAF
jgi:hypothetical protein